MRWWDAIRWLFRRRSPAAALAPALLLATPRPRSELVLPPVICLPDLTIRPNATAVAATAAVAHTPGQFYFRGAILDQLDDYIGYLKRMKRADPDAYGMYSKIGAGIYPMSRRPVFGHNPTPRELSPWFRHTLPAFGAIASGVSRPIEKLEDEEKALTPRFMWFTKYKRQSPMVEFTNLGAMYACTVYWDKKSFPKLKTGAPQEFPVVVSPDGSVRVLRSMQNQSQIIHHKHGHNRGSSTVLRHSRWGIYSGFIDWARENNDDPQSFLANLFIDVANAFQMVNSGMIRVSAKKDGITAMFGVDITRTPYFFADRDETIGPSGSKQRIFHVVRAHVRSNGRGVKLHFRGLRRFLWNGYEIHITVPGKEHLDINEWDVGVTDEYWRDEERGEYIYAPELGQRLAGVVAAAGDWDAQRHALTGPMVQH